MAEGESDVVICEEWVNIRIYQSYEAKETQTSNERDFLLQRIN